jgi:hypothetical protein
MNKHFAFTLIDLLIVVAIAAIAVPNFLEAQIRDKFPGLPTGRWGTLHLPPDCRYGGI